MSFLISLNELAVFGDKWIRLVKRFAGDDSSKGNVRLWMVYGGQTLLIWVIFARQTRTIADEFGGEAKKTKMIRSSIVYGYIAISIAGFCFRVFA